MQTYDFTKCPLFLGLSKDETDKILADTVEKTLCLEKGDYLVRQNDEINYIYLLVEGVVRTEMITSEGNLLEIDFIEAPFPLAPAFIYAHESRFPVDVIAKEPCTILLIPKTVWLHKMMTNETVLKNFLRLNSNMTVFLTKKLQMVSMKSIKSKLALYILEQTTREKNTFTLKRNRTQLAEYFGVQRPSLARTMSLLVESGILSIDKRKITVNDRVALQKLL